MPFVCCSVTEPAEAAGAAGTGLWEAQCRGWKASETRGHESLTEEVKGLEDDVILVGFCSIKLAPGFLMAGSRVVHEL